MYTQAPRRTHKILLVINVNRKVSTKEPSQANETAMGVEKDTKAKVYFLVTRR